MKLLSLAGIGLAAATMFASATPSHAVVYCKTVGVPRGCVARPVAAPVVRGPVVRAPAVAAPGVQRPVARNRVNLGGPVNRVGIR